MRFFQRVLGAYGAKLRLFSPNVRRLMLASFLTGLAMGGWQLSFNFYVLSLGGYDESFVGTLQTVESLAAILMALPMAYLAGRFRATRLMPLQILMISGAMLGVVLFPVQGVLLACRMLMGVGFAGLQVVVAPFLMANTQGPERQWAFSFNLGLNTTAVFVGNSLGGSLPSLYARLLGVGPKDSPAYQAAIATLSFIVLLALIPQWGMRPAAHPVEIKETPWHLLRHYGLRILPYILPSVVVGLGAGLMQPFMNIYFRMVYERSDWVIGLVFASGGLSMALAQFAAPPIADRLGKMNTFISSQALSIPFLLILATGAFTVQRGIGPLLLWFGLAVIAYNARLALMNMGNPVFQTFMLEALPEKISPLAVSLSSIAFQFGWFVMPQVSGRWQVAYGETAFVMIFCSVAGLYALAILMEWVFFKWGRVPFRHQTQVYTPPPADSRT